MAGVPPPCQLLRSSFSIYIQVALFVLAAGVLVSKHLLCERASTRRPWKTWLFDVSKQALSGVLAHSLNLMLAKILAAVHDDFEDECAWYAVNFTIDTTLGVGVQWILLRCREAIARRLRITALASTGDYGVDVSIRAWIQQLAAWGLNVVLTKGILGAAQLALAPQLGALGDFLLTQPLRGKPHLELTIVMLICPLGLNIAQAIALDVILKAKQQRRSPSGADLENVAGGASFSSVQLPTRRMSKLSSFDVGLELSGGEFDDTTGASDDDRAAFSPSPARR